MRLLESGRQAPLFLLFFLLGAALAAVYDLLYLFRRGGKTLPTVFSDVLFVLIVFVSASACALAANAGALHGYFLAASLAGFALGRAVWGYFLKKTIDFAADLCYNLHRRFSETRLARFLKK